MEPHDLKERLMQVILSGAVDAGMTELLKEAWTKIDELEDTVAWMESEIKDQLANEE